MATSESNLPWEELLQHGNFVRALARSLVRDGAAADDLAQSTWLAVARHPPLAVASLRGWLRRVVTNTALQERRSASRRDARERAAASRESAPPAADVEAAQLEVQQRLLAAVQALDPKYRSVVVLRFYEGLPPRRIAERLELPIATVRTHLQRAIEQLRGELDARSEKGREQWLEALAPLAIATSMPMSAVVLASAAAVVLAASGAWWAMGGGGDDGATEPNGALAALQEAPPPGEGAGESATATSATRSADASAVASARPDVSGRVVDAFGRPIEGAAIELDDRDEATAPRRAISGVDGRFAFGGVARGDSTLGVHVPGRVGWSGIVSLDRSHARELGRDIVLFEARTLRGVVVDLSGAPVAGARVVANSESLRSGVDWPETISGADGSFALDGVPTCATWLSVFAHGFARRRAGPYDSAAERCSVALVAETAPRLELVAVDRAGASLGGASVSVAPLGRDDAVLRHVRLPRALARFDLPADGRLVTDALPSGRYRFHVYSRAASCFGADVTAMLEAGATTRLDLRADLPVPATRDDGSDAPAALTAVIRGTIVDDGGAPVAGATIELERTGAAAHDSAVATTTSDFDGSFEFAALAPSSAPLRLRVGWGRPRQTIVMAGPIPLVAGAAIEEQRLVVPRLAAVAGRVVDPAGSPVHGAVVQARGPGDTIETTTARDGTFRLAGMAPCEARVALSPWPQSAAMQFRGLPPADDSLLLVLAAGEARAGLVLIDRSAATERTVHGSIESEGVLLDGGRGRAFVSLAAATDISATVFVDGESFRFDDVADARVTLLASWLEVPPSGATTPIRAVFGPRVEVSPGREPVVLRLPSPYAGAPVRAQLVAKGGADLPLPIKVELVHLDPDGTRLAQLGFSFDRPDGELRIEGLRPGRFQLRTSDDVAREFEVVAAEPVELGVVDVGPGAPIEGVVTDAAGAPLAGVRVGAIDFASAFGGEAGADWLDAKQPFAITDAEGRFSLVTQEFPMLVAVADGFAPMQLMRLPSRDGDPIVLLPCGDLVLTGFPRDLADSDAWRTALFALDPAESRVGYSPEQRSQGVVGRSTDFRRLPVGLYALCFWKGEAGVLDSREKPPTQTVAHEAYRWTVEVKEGLTTTIDLSKEW